MRSLTLRWKLAAALLAVVAVSVGLTAYLTNRSNVREFTLYTSQSRSVYMDQVENTFSSYYASNGGWTGVQDLLQQMPLSSGDRVVLADSAGRVVGDTGTSLLGSNLGSLDLGDAVPVSVGNRQVGSLYLLSSWSGQGSGMMGGMGMGMGMGVQMSTPVVHAIEGDYLDRANNALIIAGIVGAGVAVLLGLVLTRQVTRPLQALRAGAARIARGDLSHRVQVRTRDEVGDLAQSFNHMATSLQSSQQARQRLFADIAHELRTPLSVIEGTVDAMLDGVFDPSAENLGSIKAETEALTRLVADLRDLSLAESRQLKLEMDTTDIRSLMQRRVKQVEAVAQEKRVSLSFHAPGDLPSVRADERRIDQVASNLLANALNHTPQGGTVKVSVRSTRAAGGSAEVLVSVSDTGAGIPEEHLPRIFERFYRIDDARSRKTGGTGLGLAIAREMVGLHGGRIWAESRMGEGSTFTFALPVEPNGTGKPQAN